MNVVWICTKIDVVKGIDDRMMGNFLAFFFPFIGRLIISEIKMVWEPQRNFVLNLGIDQILGGALAMSTTAVDTRISSTKTTTEFVRKLGISNCKSNIKFHPDNIS